MLFYQFLFFFSAVGVFNAFLLVIYQLGIRKPKDTQQLLLGFLGLAFCIRIGVSCLYYFAGTFPWFYVQLGLTAQLLIGPLLLAFVVHGVDLTKAWKRRSLVVLVTITMLIVVFGLVYPFQTHDRVWDYHIRYAIHAVVSLFLLISSVVLYPLYKRWRQAKKLSAKEEFTAFIFLLSLLICAGFVLSLYVDYVLGPIISSVLFYVALGFAWWKKRLFIPRVKYANQKIQSEEATQLLKQLDSLIKENKCYKNPDLNIDDVATALHWPKARVSQLLNDNLGENFASYINRYRVEEAKRLLSEKKLFTVEAIGYEVGFGSRSSFYSTFKQFTGITPKKFQDQVVQ